ncbi:hypothetical protein [Brachyspira pilosicoli]|uniref:Mom family adenine methylcarbamoylation protein n=1 Tax=Brachyspira pilosicoli TaxID=52584 RepID=UPI00255C525D|nr:hypothetical protein [Brachyspira pilosicoli]
MNKDILFLRLSTYKEIKHACLNYHYSKAIPAGKYYSLSVFENKIFKGVIIFSRGACSNLHKTYKLEVSEITELTRIALKKHNHTVSHLLSIAIRMLKADNKGLKLIVSYADTEQGHRGQIYKASNFIYDGESISTSFYDLRRNKKIHSRSVIAKYGTTKNALDTGYYKIVKNQPKIRYLYFLDKEYKNFYMRTLKGK